MPKGDIYFNYVIISIGDEQKKMILDLNNGVDKFLSFYTGQDDIGQ